MHEGHRQRMLDKLETNADTLFDHEILETLLFYVIPRRNTNHTAHNLLDAFGTMTGVFNADAKSLTQIEGVGPETAGYLKCLNECIKRIDREAVSFVTLRNYADFKKFAALRLGSKTEEVLELYFLDKSNKVREVRTFTNNDTSKVGVEVSEIAAILAASKPYGIVIAHNHLSGNCNPSQSDDKFTVEMQTICSINGVRLFDHCIYAGEANIYSYFSSNRIEDVKQQFSFRNLVDTQFRNAVKNGQFRK